MRKIKTNEPIIPIKKIKTIEPVTPAKNIVSIPIELVSASITIPVEFFVIVFLQSLFENSFHYNMISNSVSLLALNVFISKIGKENLNNKELKQGHVEPIKEET